MRKRWAIGGSVRSQILILLLVFIITPTTIISAFTIDKFSEMIERNGIDMMETALDHSKENVTSFMDGAADAALRIMTNTAIIDPLLGTDAPGSVQQRITASNLLEKQLYELKIHGVQAKEIAILNTAGDKTYAGSNSFDSRYVDDADWREELDQLDGKSYWGSYTHNGSYIFVARKIQQYVKSEDRFRPLGVVLIGFAERDFASVNSSVNLANGAEILIGGADGTAISGTDPDAVGKRLSDKELPLTKGRTQLDLSGVYVSGSGSRLTVYDVIPGSDWSLIVSSSFEQLLQEQRNIKKIIVLSTGLCVVGAFMLAAALAHRMTLPLKRLSKEVKRRIANGDFAFWPLQAPARQDEIAGLGQGFYRLVADLNETKNRMHQAEMMKREAEFDAMRSKIKPHFLYNALESVRMLAVVNKDPGTAEMIKALGHLFRYIITDQKGHTTLGDELAYLHSYIQLQKLRYEDRLDVRIDVPEPLLNIALLKLVLQPLVENAIEHGINRRRGAKRISVTASRTETGEDAVIRVWDEGAGIAPDRLAEIQSSLDDPSTDKDHIGLINVHRRLRLHFGEPYGLTVDSEPGSHTSVYVRIPCSWQEGPA
ncbi:cache domain-containing sensor histidine kinase [Cohnella thailandensis]|uniref:Sensor histidine kinase n=1 Tax=Cohnella thailandensis TaxID=557557 RepID=A0A841SK14_9BACL|nr:sensor histidine kinase [Cohnella thailandensis]MBB6632863.1 sensor histidine kinase [Cohnella thailandensis]MBP1975443.1 two-component system sensor histidine kinase YesM [Cohnella thailandensis]